MPLIKVITDFTDSTSVSSVPKNQCNQCRGFTFVETLIVVTIFSVLSLAVYATFTSGMRLWKRVDEISLTQRRALLRLEKISQDLRQALNFSQIGFSGKSSELFFPLLSNDNQILKVTYFIEEDSLWRRQQTYRDILEEKEPPAARSLLSAVVELKFSFIFKEQDKADYSVKDTWAKEEGAPAAIKIELTVKKETFTKTINIPIA